MSHSYRSHYFHVVWGTKYRRPLIKKENQAAIYRYMNGIIQKYDAKLIAIGGISDHVHLLISLGSLNTYSQMIRALKTSSSGWIRKTLSQPHFAWQGGYSSFTVSYSGVHRVKSYIQNQEKHHQKRSFKKEYLQLLKKNHLQFDVRFGLGSMAFGDTELSS